MDRIEVVKKKIEQIDRLKESLKWVKSQDKLALSKKINRSYYPEIIDDDCAIAIKDLIIADYTRKIDILTKEVCGSLK